MRLDFRRFCELLNHVSGRGVPISKATSVYACAMRCDLSTDTRLAYFLGQICHESGCFRYDKEIWGPTKQQLRYDPPGRLAKTLGNTHAGDGYKYRGVGWIQLTGRTNQEHCKIWLGRQQIDPAGATEYFWVTRTLNIYADNHDFAGQTRRINGGYNGLADRQKYMARCLGWLALN
jgi:putative chitinase